MLLNPKRTRLYVVNSNADSVSIIDTQTDKEIGRINLRLSEDALPGNSPESLALKGSTLYVATPIAIRSRLLTSRCWPKKPSPYQLDDKENEREARESRPTAASCVGSSRPDNILRRWRWRAKPSSLATGKERV